MMPTLPMLRCETANKGELTSANCIANMSLTSMIGLTSMTNLTSMTGLASMAGVTPVADTSSLSYDHVSSDRVIGFQGSPSIPPPPVSPPRPQLHGACLSASSSSTNSPSVTNEEFKYF